MKFPHKIVDIRLALLNRLALKFSESLGVKATPKEAMALTYELVSTLDEQGVLNGDGSLKGYVDGTIQDHLPLVKLVKTLIRDKVIPPAPANTLKVLKAKG